MRAYRSRNQAAIIAAVAVIFAAGSIIQALRAGDVDTFARWTPPVLICALSAFCLARLARAGVYADDDGIRVVNPLRTERIPWARVLRFSLRAHKGWPALGFVELVDAEPVEIWGIQSRSKAPAARAHAQAVVDALNARLDEQRA